MFCTLDSGLSGFSSVVAVISLNPALFKELMLLPTTTSMQCSSESHQVATHRLANTGLRTLEKYTLAPLLFQRWDRGLLEKESSQKDPFSRDFRSSQGEEKSPEILETLRAWKHTAKRTIF